MLWIQKAIKPRCIQFCNVKSMIYIIPNRQSARCSKIYTLHTEVSLKQYNNLNYQKICDFHTTSKLYVPPILVLILRPILRLSAFLLGRGIKAWWRKKSTKEKEQYKMMFKENRNMFLGSLSLLCLMFILFYLTHLETDPITKRKRFIIFNKKELEALSKLFLELELERHKELLVPYNHPAYLRLLKIIQNILNKNKHLNGVNENWTLTIGRNIFCFLGVLDIVDNDDQLSIIIAHEMAHELLSHTSEELSRGLVIEILVIIPILLLWACFPDLLAFLLQMIGQHIIDLFHTLPFSRALENEADTVGLDLAARACVDVREAVVFWGIMRTLSEMKLDVDIVPWLSTHPTHGDREQSLNNKLPKALELRKLSGCPNLSPIDPRTKFYKRTAKDHEYYFKQKGIIPT
ncbi:hypothetical protein M0802_002336 [Mischocyttarus mexicanus]|nr:hypothetical protein M0802_002336 [Mischocyttarus mexicanus]